MKFDPQDWFQVQQQLWKLWQSAITPSGSASAFPFGNYDIGEFWRQFGFGQSPAFDPTSVFVSMLQPWFRAVPRNDPAADFTSWLTQGLQEFLRGATGAAEAPASPFEFVNSFMQAPLKFGQTMGGPGGFPFEDTVWSKLRPSDYAALADLPPLGPTREWELKRRRVQHSVKGEFEAAGAVGRLNAAIYRTAIKRFMQAINRNDPADGDITTLRELYDFWIDIAETAYREKVMTDQYAKAFGRYINASAERSRAWQDLVEEYQQAMNLPQRQEIDALIKGQHALREEVRELSRRPAGDDDVQRLTAQIDELTRRVENLQRAALTPIAANDSRQTETAPDTQKASERESKPAAAARKRSPAPKKKIKPPSRSTYRPRSSAADEFDIGIFGPLND